MLLTQDGADEPEDGGWVGEDADDISPALDFLVEAFERVIRPALAPVLVREGELGQDIGLSLIHEVGHAGEALPEAVSDGAPLLAGTCGIGLGEDGPDGGRDHLSGRLRDQRQQVAQEMDPAALPARAVEGRLDRALESLVRIAEHQLDPTEAPSH